MKVWDITPDQLVKALNAYHKRQDAKDRHKKRERRAYDDYPGRNGRRRP